MAAPSLILCIDTAMNGCSVGLYDADQNCITRQKITEMTRGQAEHLMPMIEEVMQESGHGYDNLDAIAVTRGPGAFTGMRIGLATAKSLGMVLDIPVIGVCTFQAVLQTYLLNSDAKTHDLYGVLLETKRQDYYFQMFSSDDFSPYSGKMAATAKEVLEQLGDKPCALIGDASARFKTEINPPETIALYDVTLPDPLAIARLAAKTSEENYSSEPIYLRAPEVGVPKTPPRKLKA